MQLKRVWFVCVLVWVSTYGMIPIYYADQEVPQENGGSHEQATHTLLHWRHKEGGYVAYDESSGHTSVPPRSSSLCVTKRCGGYLFEFPYMMSLLQYKNMRCVAQFNTWVAQCAICDAHVWSNHSLSSVIKNHCNKEHYARFIWMCLCGKYFYSYHSDNLRKHIKICNARNTGNQYLEVTSSHGHFVLRLQGTTYHVCSACGKLHTTPHTLDCHKQTCPWRHQLEHVCQQGGLHNGVYHGVYPEITRVPYGVRMVELTHLRFPLDSEDAVASLMHKKMDNTWLVQCDQCEFQVNVNCEDTAKKKTDLQHFGIHYNNNHVHKYLYICPCCGYCSHSFDSVKRHICLFHDRGEASSAQLDHLNIHSYSQFCKLVFTSENDNIDNYEFPIQEHDGGYFTACPDCCFFITNEYDASDVQQAMRDHYNEKHRATHIYICACGQFFYAKRLLDVHLNHHNSQCDTALCTVETSVSEGGVNNSAVQHVDTESHVSDLPVEHLYAVLEDIYDHNDLNNLVQAYQNGCLPDNTYTASTQEYEYVDQDSPCLFREDLDEMFGVDTNDKPSFIEEM